MLAQYWIKIGRKGDDFSPQSSPDLDPPLVRALFAMVPDLN